MTSEGEHTMKQNHFLRMRQSGWFDVFILFLAVAALFGVMGLIGYAQHTNILGGMSGEFSEYEIKEAHGFFAGSYGPFLVIAGLCGGFSLIGLFSLRFFSPWVRADLKRQLASRRIRVAVQYIVAIAFTLVMLFPIYWMIISSLKSSEELLRPVPTLWPDQFIWENYPNVLSRAPFGLYFFNTIVSTFFIMAGELLLGIFAAYGFSKGEFKYKNGLFLLVLGALMVPIQVTFIPIYVMIAKLNWLNSFPGLIIPNLVSAYFIFMLRQTFMSVDNSYLEAGRVDGMGRVRAIFNVLCPMCRPTLITVGIITFINGWNSYFWPKMITTVDKRRTIAVGVIQLRRTFAGMETANYNEIMAGAVLAILPIVVLFLVLQRYIMTGLSKAAMK